MTSIRDISNNRNKLHDDYKNTKREIDKIIHDFEQLQKKKLPLEVYSVLKYELRIHFLNADNRRIELQKKFSKHIM
jgi:hypothetical protein